MHLNIAVGIPTIGRAIVLRETLIELTRQNRRPDKVIVCGTRPTDVEGAAEAYPGTIVLLSEPGLPRQRNAVIEAAVDADIVVFFDDDFLPDPGYLAAVEQHMARDPQIVVATGAAARRRHQRPGSLARTADERSCRATRHRPAAGRLTSSPRFPVTDATWPSASRRCVRMACGSTSACRCMAGRRMSISPAAWPRSAGWCGSMRRAGFISASSPDADPACGSATPRSPIRFISAASGDGYPLRRAIGHIAKNMAMNIARAIWPEPYVDRRGRLYGNLLALRDLTVRRMVPERILDL